ncbi:MAG: hypothetical protein WCX12_02030 [Candidatus Paceibacterota bacterium]|jgi:hypothetical protein
MRGDYERLFGQIDHLEPPDGLLDKIILRINTERRRRTIRFRIGLFGVLAVTAVAAFIPAWQELQSEMAGSGFSQFFSLIFSDTQVVLTYWREFILSLIESMPILGITVVLGLVLVFLASVKFLVRDFSAVFSRSQLIKTN